MEEVWRDVIGYEGYFKVSNLGRIQNRRGKIRKPWLVAGYPTLTLSIGPDCKSFPIHRLVAQAFVPNPENLPVVRHKDNCRDNPRADNLVWGTKKDNMEDLSKFYKEAVYYRKEIAKLKAILKSLGYEE